MGDKCSLDSNFAIHRINFDIGHRSNVGFGSIVLNKCHPAPAFYVRLLARLS